MKILKRILLIILLIVLLPNIILGINILYCSISNDDPVTNTAADKLRYFYGNDFVIFLEEKMYQAKDYYNVLTNNEKVVLIPNSIRKEQIEKHEMLAKKISYKHKNSKREPIDLIPIIESPKLENEGKWVEVKGYDKIFYKTKIRVNPEKHWSVTELCKIDLNRVKIKWTSGNKYKDKNGKLGKGKIELKENEKLLAAFNGGFMPKHDNGGMWFEHKELVPMKDELATLIINDKDEISLFKYTKETEAKIKNNEINIKYARQNHPMIMENNIINEQTKNWGIVLITKAVRPSPGAIAEMLENPNTAATASGYIYGNKPMYVYSTSSKPIYAWRSGIGITKDNWLVYAAANDITAQKLAESLKMADCYNAMHLDMNSNHLIFNFYEEKAKKKHLATSFSDRFHSSLLNKYQQGYGHDFFYIVQDKKSINTNE